MSTLSPIDELREIRKTLIETDIVGGVLLEVIDRVLAADISISWLNDGVRRTKSTVDRFQSSHHG